MLKLYPDRNIARELVQGFNFGLSIHYTGIRSSIISKKHVICGFPRRPVTPKNISRSSVGSYCWPFQKYSKNISNLCCSPIGVVPKKQGGWGMICNLSAPQGQSVNDFINPEQCSVQYTSFDDTTAMISKLGRGALLGKKDIGNVFRLLPICPEDFPLLGFHFKHNFYIDKCLPFGCSIACATFENFSTSCLQARQISIPAST